MNRDEEWNEFLDNLLMSALKQRQDSREQECLKHRKAYIDEIIHNNVAPDLHADIEEILFELGLYEDRETEFGYKQGIKDCVFMLKNLGVIA